MVMVMVMVMVGTAQQGWGRQEPSISTRVKQKARGRMLTERHRTVPHVWYSTVVGWG
eukprot:COSAG01_NODE_36956_length_510_cov_1.004866_2_plen_56_part_01